MKTYGLIGKKLSHSFSPAYFEKKFKILGIDAKYLLFEVEEIGEVKEIIRNNPELAGLNVTIPYKEDILKLVDTMNEVAAAVGSVNLLKIERGEWGPVIYGFNTDVIGCEKTLRPFAEGRSNMSALVLGTGGAAKAVVYVLAMLNIPFEYVSRTPSGSQLGYEELNEEIVKAFPLIVNTTPVGMFPYEHESPEMPYQYLTQDHILFDLIYNPAETLFLKKGRERGCRTINGLRMLELQADASWEVWNA